MISRRHMAGAVGAGTAAALIGDAHAQNAASSKDMALAGESTFDRIRRTGKLRIAAIADGAPYYRRDATSREWRGFSVDISRALANELDVDLDIVESTWGNVMLDLQSNKIDIFFGLNPIPKRALLIDFSVPVFSAAFTMIMRRGGSARSWADFNAPEIRISVEGGSSSEQVLARVCAKSQIIRMRSAEEATAALQGGRVDAQCLTLMPALAALRKSPGLGQIAVPTPTFFTASSAGFRREPDRSWREYVNTWIEFNRGIGLVRQIIVASLEQIGVNDIPAGISL